MGKPEGKSQLVRSGHRWKGTVTFFVTELGWEGIDWNSLCQDRDKRVAGVKTVLGVY
jgi:hypothetical protein